MRKTTKMCKEDTQTKLNKYKAQLTALKKDKSYDSHKKERELLVLFYQKKIKRLEESVKGVQTQKNVNNCNRWFCRMGSNLFVLQ